MASITSLTLRRPRGLEILIPRWCTESRHRDFSHYENALQHSFVFVPSTWLSASDKKTYPLSDISIGESLSFTIPRKQYELLKRTIWHQPELFPVKVTERSLHSPTTM